MKRLLPLALCLLAGACGQKDSPPVAAQPPPAASAGPMEVLQRFYDDLAAGDAEAARALALPLSDAELRRGFDEDLGEGAALFQSRELGARAVEARVDEPWAVVVARHVRYEGGAEAEVRLRDEFLYRTPEGWRLASEAFRADPAIAPLWDEHAARLLDWYRASFDDLSSRYR